MMSVFMELIGALWIIGAFVEFGLTIIVECVLDAIVKLSLKWQY